MPLTDKQKTKAKFLYVHWKNYSLNEMARRVGVTKVMLYDFLKTWLKGKVIR